MAKRQTNKLVLKLSLSAALALVLGAHCTHRTPTPENQNPAWAARMQQLSQVMGELYPLLMSEKKFSAQENQAKVKNLVNQLSGLGHSINPSARAASTSASPPDQDPTLRFIANEFDQEIHRINEALASGHRSYARHGLLNVTNYCVECHTRSAMGPQFPKLELGVNEASLPIMERAEFLVATRQYDKALA